jgi:hypothetical protein
MFSKDIYIEAAREHALLAQQLYNRRWFGAVHYWAGLAVECLLRGYRVRIDPVFDSRHDLRDLATLGKFFEVIPPTRQKWISACLSEVVRRWTNEHRFRSARAIRSWLKTQDANWKFKGDVLKESARRISNAALEIVMEGVLRWPHK